MPVMSLHHPGETDLLFRARIQLQYLEDGFDHKTGFIGYKKFKDHMDSLYPNEAARKKIQSILAEHRKVPHGNPNSLGDPVVLSADKTQRSTLIKELQGRLNSSLTMSQPTPKKKKAAVKPFLFAPAASSTISSPSQSPYGRTSTSTSRASPSLQLPSSALPVPISSTSNATGDSSHSTKKPGQISTNSDKATDGLGDLDDKLINLLLPEDDDGEIESSKINIDILHAPLVSRQIVSLETQKSLPQLGLLGTYQASPLFLNTNIPFSAFICGVQGSGKSHTTSCMLENSLINSRHLGRLQSPLSALVFSYGQFSGDGTGFNISEAAFLTTPGSTLQGHASVKGITVLVAPSNFVQMSKLYSRLPKVIVRPFMLNPKDLSVDIMLTLMAVNDSGALPLYMAQVTNILRKMATAGLPFDYQEFKKQLKDCNFNPSQKNMLQLRLDLLESFLDLTGKTADERFEPGILTIMDMSCPFVDASTACVLFKIGLQKFLQSKALGKMVVLDEAHKYMLENPGAKSLNESLLQIIRLQRHYGVRVIVSTQEPTLLTDLIALCSVVIVHRFSSPEWFQALKRHIPVASYNGNTSLIQEIEGLKTGTALVYSSNAVLGKDDEGRLIKGTGKMLKVQIRKRVTMDGGQSILAS